MWIDYIKGSEFSILSLPNPFQVRFSHISESHKTSFLFLFASIKTELFNDKKLSLGL